MPCAIRWQTVTSIVTTNQIPPVDSNFKTLLTKQGPYVSITTHLTLYVYVHTLT